VDEHAGSIWVRLLALFAGGFSETYLSLQIVLLLTAILCVAWFVRGTPRRNWLVLLASALAGSLIALLIVIASPGNASRMAFMPESPGVLALAVMVFKNAFIFIYSSLADHFFAALLAILIPMLLVYLHSSKNPELPGWSPHDIDDLLTLLSPFTSHLGGCASACNPLIMMTSGHRDVYNRADVARRGFYWA
jgi:hypothetical protein